MRIRVPSFKSRLLTEICEALAERSKTLNYAGAVSFEAGALEGGLEAVSLSIASPYAPSLELRLLALEPVADVYLTLALRSERRRSRGQALFSLREAPLSRDPRGFVDLLLWTRAQGRHLRGDPLRVESLHQAWAKHLAP